MAEPLLAAHDIVAGYGRGDEILKGVHLTVEDGDIVAIIGPNGAGKSTLLKTIAGLLHPARGSITLRGEPIHGLAATRDQPARRRFRAAGTERLRHAVGPRELGDGGLDRACGHASAHRGGVRTFPPAGRMPQPSRAHLVGRTTPSTGHGNGADGAPDGFAARRTVRWSVAGRRRDACSTTIQSINRDGIAIAMVEQNATQALEIAHRASILVDGRNNRDGAAADLAADPDIRRLFLGATPAEQYEEVRCSLAAGCCRPQLSQHRAIGHAQVALLPLGMLTPLTGAGAFDGPRMLKAIEAVVSEINGTGGVLGRKIALVVEDDETNPEAAVRAAHKLIDVTKCR